MLLQGKMQILLLNHYIYSLNMQLLAYYVKNPGSGGFDKKTFKIWTQ